MSIKAVISVDNSELKKGLKEAEGQASKSMNTVKKTVEGASTMFGKLASSANNASQAISTGMQGVTTTLSKLGPIGIAAAAGITLIGSATVGVFSLVNKLSNRLNDISKSAKSVNMTANQYLALQYASKRAGVAMEDVLSIISKTDQAMTKAAEGEAKYRDAFYALGLTWRELSKLSPEKQIMAVTEAFSKLNAEGRSVPSDVYSVYSRKDIRNLNKLSKEDVGRLVAEAGALGVEIDENTIRTAEALLDVTGDIDQKFLAWVTKIKAVKKGMELIKDIAEDTSNIMNSNGEVKPEYADKYESFITVAKRLAAEGKFNDAVKRELIIENYKSRLRGQPSDQRMLMDFANKVKAMGPDELQKEFNNIKFNKMGKSAQEAMQKAVANVDRRFINGVLVAGKNNASSFLQTKEEIEASKILDKAEDTNKELEKQIKYYDSISNKIGLEFDVERKIADLEAELAEKTKGRVMQLDESVKLTMKQNAALMQQKAIETEIKKINDLTATSKGRSATELLSIAGANRTGVAQINEELSNIGFENGISDQLTKFIKQNWVGKSTSLNAMLKENPRGFYDLLNISANSLSNEGFNLVTEDDLKNALMNLDSMKKLRAEYNDFAKRNNLSSDKGPFIDFDNIEKNLEPYIDNLEKIKQLEEDLRKLNRDNPKGESLRKTSIANEITKLREPLIILNEVKKAKEALKGSELLAKTSQFAIDATAQANMIAAVNVLKQTENLQKENDLTKAILTNNKELVEVLKRKKILEDAGIASTDKNLKEFSKVLDVARAAQNDAASTNIFKDLIVKGTELSYSLSKNSGDALKANRELAVFNAQIQKGGLLTDEEKSLIERLSDLSTNADIIKMPSRLDDVIHTNELARRGGFSESVAVERRDNTERIVEYLSRMQKLSTDIRKFVNDINDKCTINY